MPQVDDTVAASSGSSRPPVERSSRNRPRPVTRLLALANAEMKTGPAATTSTADRRMRSAAASGPPPSGLTGTTMVAPERIAATHGLRRPDIVSGSATDQRRSPGLRSARSAITPPVHQRERPERRTPFAGPVVPEVKRIAASSAGARRTIGGGATSANALSCAPRCDSCSSAWGSSGSRTASGSAPMCRSAFAPVSSANIAEAPTESSAAARWTDAIPGLSGTTTAPDSQMAQVTRTFAGWWPATTRTRSPGSTP